MLWLSWSRCHETRCAVTIVSDNILPSSSRYTMWHIFSYSLIRTDGKLLSVQDCRLNERDTNAVQLEYKTRAFVVCYEPARSLNKISISHDRPPLWSSGQSFWLQIQRSRVRSLALPDFLSSSGSGTGPLSLARSN